MDWWKRYSGMDIKKTVVECQNARLIDERIKKNGLASLAIADSVSVVSVSAGKANGR